MAMAANLRNKIRQIVRLKQAMHRWRARHVIPILIGPDRTRSTVPARFINLPVFVSLLNQSREEFGYQPEGVLALPSCDPELFRVILAFLQLDEDKYGRLSVHEFSKFLTEQHSSSSFNECSARGLEPLLQKA